VDPAPGGPAWLAALPSGTAWFVSASVVIVILVALRGVLTRSAAGRRFIDAIHRVESWTIATFLLTMILLSFFQIVLRNAAGSGLLWIDPLLRHLLLWIGFAGAALAARLDRHMHIEALSRVLPRSASRGARLVTLAATAVVCVILSGASFDAVREESQAGTASFLGIPTWCLQVVIPFGFFFMAYRFARRSWAVAESPLAGMTLSSPPAEGPAPGDPVSTEPR